MVLWYYVITKYHSKGRVIIEQQHIDQLAQLQRDVTELKTRVNALDGAGELSEPLNIPDTAHYKNGTHVRPMKNMHPDARLSGIMDDLTRITEGEERTGSVTYAGVFTSGGRQSNWIRHSVNTDHLLALAENRTAAAVLQCVGSNDRLNILLALLQKPMTVAALVEHCGFNTTGQAYHHLKPLITADLIAETEQGERGVYAVKFHRVQGIIMLLAGIADLTDEKYSSGNWA